MQHMPIEVFVNEETGRVNIKQRLSLHDEQDFIVVEIYPEQSEQLQKELKKLSAKTTAPKAAGATDKFDSHFWSLWPANQRKVDKKGCMAHWAAHNLDIEADAVAAGVRASLKSPDWLKENGAFIPQPKTWLNQRRWEAAAASGQTTAPAESNWKNRIV